jgi:hypothetical protein
MYERDYEELINRDVPAEDFRLARRALEECK